MKTETWKPCPTYQGYSASSNGRIKGRRGRVMVLARHHTGYLRARISDGKAARSEYAHRIVADAFYGPCPAGKEVNHLNGVKSDNRPENLEYVTRSENAKHSFRVLGRKHSRLGKFGKDCPSAKRLNVVRIARQVRSGETLRAIAEQHGCCQHTLTALLHGKHWQSDELPDDVKTDRRRTWKKRPEFIHYGEQSPRSKRVDCGKILSLRASGLSYKRIAPLVGVSWSTVRAVCNGTHWQVQAQGQQT